MSAARRLELRDLALRYGDVSVLDGVSLDVGVGEFASILGPSGAGKSTILRALTGAATADGGAVLFDGQPLGLATRPFGFMSQCDALMPWRRIIDNAALGLEVRGMSRRAAHQHVALLFPEFGLAGFEQHYPSALSGGMRQRVALLRTVVQGCSMLLLDEPLGALDALTRSRMQLWLEGMWLKHRWTVMMVTHDIREAVLLSDRIYLLSPRPTRVAHIVEIDLPRPRLNDARVRAQAAAIESQILDLLFASINERLSP